MNCHKTNSCCIDTSFARTNSCPECLAVGEQPKGNGVWAAEEFYHPKAPCGFWILNWKVKGRYSRFLTIKENGTSWNLSPWRLHKCRFYRSSPVWTIFLSVKWHWHCKGLSCFSWQQRRSLSCWRPLARLTLCPFVKLSNSFCFEREQTSFRRIRHFSLCLSDGSL